MGIVFNTENLVERMEQRNAETRRVTEAFKEAMSKAEKVNEKTAVAALDNTLGRRGNRNKPHCPTHNSIMEFAPARGMWECPDPNCAMVSMPERDAGKGKPVVGKGTIELFRVVEDDGSVSLFLRSGDNVMLDITAYCNAGLISISQNPGTMLNIDIPLTLHHYTEA